MPMTPRKIRFLSVVVPAYNEEDCIGGTLGKIREFLGGKPFDFEIIVVDDGSCDRTAEIVENLGKQECEIKLIKNDKNMGKGFSVRKGVMSAEGDYVLFMDADSSTSIEEFEKFQPYLENGSLIAIGSRREKASKIAIAQPFYRVFMGQTFTFLARHLVAAGVHDFTCGFKCFERATARMLFSRQRLIDWSFDAEILHIAHRNGIKIEQVPIVWEDHPNSKVRILRSVALSLLGLIRITLNSFSGKY